MSEPVAWLFRGHFYDTDPSDWTVHEHPNVPVIPLYTHPAELTDEEIGQFKGEWYRNDYASFYDLVRAILRKAQEK